MRFLLLFSSLFLGILLFSCKKDAPLTTTDTLNSVLPRDTVTIDELPTAILDYITTNYPNSQIVRTESETEEDGTLTYEIVLSTGEVLRFDATGNFVGFGDLDDDDDDNDNDNDSDQDDDNDLLFDQLPQNVQDYLTANYPNMTFDEAEQDTLCDGTLALLVELENNNQQDLELAFDAGGQLLYTATSIVQQDLPMGIADAIANAYPSYQIEDDIDKLSWANGNIQYRVELESTLNGQDSDLIVLFSSDGTFLCEEIE